jgi:ribonuclease HI
MIIFTDGAAKSNGKLDAIGGIGVFFDNNSLFNYGQKITFETYNKQVTNNLTELLAIQKALHISISLGKTNNLTIYTDSKYCYNIFTSWALSWEKKGWKKHDGKPILNLDLIKNIHKLVKLYKIGFKHCNSHLEPPENKNSEEYKIWYGNNQADALANKYL